MVAEDSLTDEQIASTLGCSKSTLERLKRQEAFRGTVVTIVADTAAALKAQGIAEAQARIDDHVDLHNRMRQVIEERAASLDFADVPGGQTGLLAHNIKVVGGGAFAERVDVYEVDTGLIAAINANKKQVAQERGQWQEPRTPKSVTARATTGEGEQRVEFVIEIGDGNDDTDD